MVALDSQAKEEGTDMGSKAMTTEYSYTMHLEAPATDVFPLLCPVRENDWVVGWQDITTLVHSGSGVAELGAVFQTAHAGATPETWVITEYRPAERIAFARFDGDVVTRLNIDLAEQGGRTTATWVTSQVAINPAGDTRVAGVTQERHDVARAGLEVMLQHYLRTGKMIDREALRRRLDAAES